MGLLLLMIKCELLLYILFIVFFFFDLLSWLIVFGFGGGRCLGWCLVFFVIFVVLSIFFIFLKKFELFSFVKIR